MAIILPTPNVTSELTAMIGSVTTKSFPTDGCTSPYFLLPINDGVSYISIPCGYPHPPFCNDAFYNTCWNQTIAACENCDMGLAAAFLLFVVLLGLAIVLGNALIAIVGYRRYKDGKATKMDFCKSSLAVADTLTG